MSHIPRARAQHAAYDIFNLTWMKEPVQCIVGLTAALIS